MGMEGFVVACTRALGDGVTAAALLDRDGTPVAVAGSLAAMDLRAIAGVVTASLKGDELAASLFAGKSFDFVFNQQTVSITVAARCVFVAVVCAYPTPAARERASALHRDTETIVRGMSSPLVPHRRGPDGGAGSGPAELPVIELGVTPGVKPRN